MTQIRTELAPWNERIEALVTELAPVCGMESLRENVLSGNIVAYEFFLNEVSAGFFLTTEDKLWNGKRELVILHALSEKKIQLPIASLVSVFVPQLAKEKGYSSVRIHSARKGLDAVLEDSGFRFIESVFLREDL